MDSNYKTLLRELHCAIDTGNPGQASHVLHVARECNIPEEQLGELADDFRTAFPDYQE